MSVEMHDVVVLGVGGMGSATLYSLAKRGLRACGIEQFDLAHDRGSSHGETRIIRKAYFEDPAYLPLLERAYALWDSFQTECGEELLVPCEMVVSGPVGGEAIRGLAEAFGKYPVPHERLSLAQAGQRFPMIHFPAGFEVYCDPAAGFLRVEKAVRELARRAGLLGAAIYRNEPVTAWKSTKGSVIVETAHRQLEAKKLIVTAGAWAARQLATLKVNFELWRKSVFWYDSPNIEPFHLGRFPIFYIELDYGSFYGFPAINEFGVKIAEHRIPDPVQSPEQLDRSFRASDEVPVLRFVKDIFRDFQPRRTRFSVCMYTKTPDDHFILDIHPEDDNVIFGCGFSGHGFKFAPVVGEVLADLALEGSTDAPIDFLRLARLTSAMP